MNQLINREKQNEQPDLSLRLSLGGIYCESSKENKSLTRSLSVSGVLSLDRKPGDGEQLHASLPNSFLSLERSSSLPTETELLQQRKEILMELGRRRIEAFVKKRSDSTNDKSPPSITPASSNSIFKIKAHLAFCRITKKDERNMDVTAGLEELAVEKDIDNNSSQSDEVVAHMITWGTNANANGKSVKGESWKLESPSKKVKNSHNGYEDNGMAVMRQMPSVTTRGEGPNGRKIEGFLYKYTKGQVSIVCVCHGSFLSPAEFVKHAGGKDVSNPMKHISVSPLSFN